MCGSAAYVWLHRLRKKRPLRRSLLGYRRKKQISRSAPVLPYVCVLVIIPVNYPTLLYTIVLAHFSLVIPDDTEYLITNIIATNCFLILYREI